MNKLRKSEGSAKVLAESVALEQRNERDRCVRDGCYAIAVNRLNMAKRLDDESQVGIADGEVGVRKGRAEIRDEDWMVEFETSSDAGMVSRKRERDVGKGKGRWGREALVERRELGGVGRPLAQQGPEKK